MKAKKMFDRILSIVIITIIALVIIYFVEYIFKNKEALVSPTITSSTTIISPVSTTTKPMLIGGDKDAHGCLPSAGYSWCEIKQKCLRVWEEPCK